LLHFFNITGRQLYRLHIPGQYFHNLSLLGVDTKSGLRCNLLKKNVKTNLQQILKCFILDTNNYAMCLLYTNLIQQNIMLNDVKNNNNLKC